MGMMDMMGMMGKMKDLQAKMKEAQDNLETIIAHGESGAGMVKVTANGKKQLIKIEIEPDLVKPEDLDVLTDLIVAAANKALQNAEEASKVELQKATEGIMPNIPGMDLNNLFNK